MDKRYIDLESAWIACLIFNKKYHKPVISLVLHYAIDDMCV